MSDAGPVFTGFSPSFDLLAGETYRLFAAADIVDASSQQISLTVTLSNTGAGALFDPNAGADGSSYDAAMGVYTVSGTPAEVSAALRGLQWIVPANPTATSVSVSFAALDGLGNLSGPGLSATLLSPTTYSGGGRVIALVGNGPPSGLILDATGGAADVVTSTSGAYAVAALDDALATFDVGALLYVGAGDTATLAADVGFTAYGDDAAFTLDGADLSVVGDDDLVTFPSGALDAVSFWGPGAGFVETVAGSGGTVVENGVEVRLTGDGDTIYFEGAGNALDLTGAWSVLYATSGAVNLTGASLSIVGGGVTVNAVSGDDAVSLYETDQTGFTVNGAGLTVTLNGATQAAVNGSGDAIWFEGGSGSTVTTNSPATAPDTVFGAGTVDVAGGGVNDVGGGALVAFMGAEDYADLSFTNGIWDRVEDASGIVGGTVHVFDAQAAVYGGNLTVIFDDPTDTADSVSLNQTGGNWDSVYGLSDGYNTLSPTLIVNSAQVNLFAAFQTVYLDGAGDVDSLYGGGYNEMNLIGDDQTVVVNTYTEATLTGGANTLYLNGGPTTYATVGIAETKGAWDAVYAQDSAITMTDAQASVLGGGNYMDFDTSGEQVSLYNTGGVADSVTNTLEDGIAAVSLTNADCNFYGSGYYGYGGGYVIYSGGGTNTATLTYGSTDTLVLQGAFGELTVSNFSADDFLILSKSQFADYQAFESALSAPDGDTLKLTLDANDTVTFQGLQPGAISAAQVSFV